MPTYSLVLKKGGNGYAEVVSSAGVEVCTVYTASNQQEVLQLLGQANAMSMFSLSELNAVISDAYSWRQRQEALKKQQQEEASKKGL